MNLIFRTIARYVVARLKEASTYRNLILLVGGTWAASNPTQVEALIPVLLSVVGLIGTFFPDLFGAPANATPTAELPPIDLVARAESGDSAAHQLYQPVVPTRDESAPTPAERFNWNG